MWKGRVGRRLRPGGCYVACAEDSSNELSRTFWLPLEQLWSNLNAFAIHLFHQPALTCQSMSPLFVSKLYVHHASRDEPQYIIKSDKTEHIGIHKGCALRRVKARI